MISAVLLAPEVPQPNEGARVAVARSLGWLVSAVVAGVVGDVVLAAPAGLDLAAIADEVGCELAEGPSEAARLREATARARRPLVLVLRAGYQPLGPLIEELDARTRAGAPAALVATPNGLLARIRPWRARVVGVLAARDACLRAASLTELARACRDRFASDARPFG